MYLKKAEIFLVLIIIIQEQNKLWTSHLQSPDEQNTYNKMSLVKEMTTTGQLFNHHQNNFE